MKNKPTRIMISDGKLLRRSRNPGRLLKRMTRRVINYRNMERKWILELRRRRRRK